MDDRMTAEFDELDEYKEDLGNVHAPEGLRKKVVNMAYRKRKVSTGVRAAWAFAAAAVVVVCLCFRSQIMAFAENVTYKFTYIIDKKNDKGFSGDMGYVHVNTLKWEDFQHKYSSIEELEKLLGIKLIKSDLAYSAPFSNIELQRFEEYSDYNNAVTYQIVDEAYFVNNMQLNEVTDSGYLMETLGDDAYKISYTATIHNDPRLEQDDVWKTDSYSGAVYIEDYATAEGYTAYIYSFDNEYHAVIFDHNIKYMFAADDLGTMDSLDEFKGFLDTLGY